MHVLAMLLAHPAVVHKGPGLASQLSHDLKPVLAWIVRHIGILLAVIILLVLWRRAGAVLWHLLMTLAVGIVLFPSVAPSSVQTALGKVTKTGQHVGSTGLSVGLLAIMIGLLVLAVVVVGRSAHAPLARGVKKMARQGAPEGEEG